MRSFAISTDRIGPKRWWIVRVHPTVDELRQVARRYRPDSHAWVDAWGVCQPTSYRIDGDGTRRYPSNGFAGVIRLTDELFTAEIVAHELVHAALATYRMNVTHRADLGEGVDESEESFAYIYGELYASLETRLHEEA